MISNLLTLNHGESKEEGSLLTPRPPRAQTLMRITMRPVSGTASQERLKPAPSLFGAS